MRIEMIVNGTFWAKYRIFVIFRKMPRSGVTERRVGPIDLNPASIYRGPMDPTFVIHAFYYFLLRFFDRYVFYCLTTCYASLDAFF